ncbi:low temperature requirement protein A [uncultured Granulicatella sp.]|uniref:low temperature requirement protein A n=1 Tax=uncultured Granulicatella sp. TaxID=316089 RepID=UPI00259AC71F|nr:low temperature requirement protein A [uncultured Granulicatella sp.]
MKAKKVSNYELFFDLVFVLATSQLVGILHSTPEHIVNLQGILAFFVATISVWSVWLLENSYLNRYSRRDANDIYTIIAAALVIGNMVTLFTANWRLGIVNFNGIAIPVYIYYNLLMIVVLGIIIMQYLLHIRKYQQCTNDMVIQIKGIFIAIVIVIVSMVIISFTPVEYINYIYLFSYLAFLIYPTFMTKKMKYRYMNFPHLVERMQLITILTVGELVIAVIKTYPLAEHFLLSVSTFVMVGFLFVSYISQTVIGIEHHQERAGGPLVYLHIGILIAINIITAGVEMYYDGQLLEMGSSMVLVGITLFYICLFGTSRYNKEGLQMTKELARNYFIVYLIGMFLAFLFKTNTPIFFGILAIQSVVMTRVAFRSRRDWVRDNIQF